MSINALPYLIAWDLFIINKYLFNLILQRKSNQRLTHCQFLSMSPLNLRNLLIFNSIVLASANLNLTFVVALASVGSKIFKPSRSHSQRLLAHDNWLASWLYLKDYIRSSLRPNVLLPPFQFLFAKYMRQVFLFTIRFYYHSSVLLA